MMKYFLIILSVVFISLNLSAQQLFRFSQHVLDPYTVNHSFAGNREKLEASFFLRNQWTGFKDAPKTQLISLHTKLKSNVAVGGTAYNDIAGPSRRSSVQLSYSYWAKLQDKTYLSLSFGASYNQYNLNKQALTFHTPNDQVTLGNNDYFLYPDAVLSFALISEKIGLGISVPQLLRNEFSFAPINNKQLNIIERHLVVNGYYHVSISEDLSFSPYFLIKTIPSFTTQYEATAIINWKETFWFGGGYRNEESLLLLLGLQKDFLKIGYGFDYLLNDIANYSYGSHEIYLGIRINKQTVTSNSSK